MVEGGGVRKGLAGLAKLNTYMKSCFYILSLNSVSAHPPGRILLKWKLCRTVLRLVLLNLIQFYAPAIFLKAQTTNATFSLFFAVFFNDFFIFFLFKIASLSITTSKRTRAKSQPYFCLIFCRFPKKCVLQIDFPILS